ncbi:MAG: replicative DNA helicase [Candidatus Dadabacteria bacterium]|nr:MAG: replicative DNA helicase [Candidatus Dadabacteria bacterium]
MAKPTPRYRDKKSGYGKEGESALGLARTPPNSMEAEESLLGGILIDNDSINSAMEVIVSEDFYKPAHRKIFEAMAALSEKGEPIDIVTLSAKLRSLNYLEECGGIEYLSKLASITPASAHVGYYARLVKAAAIRRRLIHEAIEIINGSYAEECDIEDYLDEVEQRILQISDYKIRPSFYEIGSIVKDSIGHVEKLYEQKEPVTGVASGFRDLDKITAGFQPSDLIIIAARPSMGKTSLALGIVQHVGVHQGKPVALFSMEMSKEQLVLRILCSEARVDGSGVRTGNLKEKDFPRLVEAASRVADAPIYIDDTPALTVAELRAKSRRLHKEHPLSLIVVDYLQLMRSPAFSSISREQEISDISRSLKALAKELNIPVIALSQLNRSVESRNDKRPLMSDLRESGAIEQDADVIAFIYRDEFYNKETEDKGVAEIIISKQRNGPTGVVKLTFTPEYTRFDDFIDRDDIGYIEEDGSEFEFSDSADDLF